MSVTSLSLPYKTPVDDDMLIERTSRPGYNSSPSNEKEKSMAQKLSSGRSQEAAETRAAFVDHSELHTPAANAMGSVARSRSEGNGARSQSEGNGARSQSEGNGAKSQSEGNGAKSQSEGNGAKSQSEGNGAKSQSEGNGARSQSEGNGARSQSEGNGAKSQSEGNGAKSQSEGNGAKSQSEGNGARSQSEGNGARSQSEGNGGRQEGARRGSMHNVLEAIEAAERELEELDASEEEMDERLRLYTDVIKMRKEHELLGRDTVFSRMYLQMGDDILSHYEPSLETKVAAFEEEAQRSNLQEVWEKECRENPLSNTEDKSLWMRVNLECLSERVDAALEKFHSAEQAKRKLQGEVNGKNKSNTVEQGQVETREGENMDKDMAKLVETRKRLKQVDADQRFHLRRGTNVKVNQFSSQLHDDISKHRVYVDESKQFANVLALRNELTDLTEQVNQSTRVLEDNKRAHTGEERKLEKQLAEVKESGKDARELRVFFERENEELKALKQDMQQVLQYIRACERKAFLED